jgi:hypothetical protein
MGELREIKEAEVVPNADAKPGVLITEQTLICKNEAALAVIADLFGLPVNAAFDVPREEPETKIYQAVPAGEVVDASP